MFTAPRRRSSAKLFFMKVMLAALFAWAAPAAAQEPTSTPSPTPAATPSPTPSATPSPTPGATPSPTPGAIPSPTPGATPAPTPSPTPAPAQTPSAAPVQAAEPATPALAEEPLFKEYKGVTLGMSLEEVRGKLGQPKEKDKSQDIFIFSDAERARVYYDGAGKANAIVITYVGKSSGAPEPKSVIGIDIAPTESGTLYKLVTYPRAGYSIAYSRTAGDEPLTMITMQKVATTSQ